MISSYRITKQIETSIGARNLFDTDYVSPSRGIPTNDYPMPGRYLFLELKYRFN